MNLNDSKELIDLELKIRGENEDHTFYSFEFYEPSIGEMKTCVKEFSVSWFTKYIFESYCGYTSGYINSSLRSHEPQNNFG